MDWNKWNIPLHIKVLVLLTCANRKVRRKLKNEEEKDLVIRQKKIVTLHVGNYTLLKNLRSQKQEVKEMKLKTGSKKIKLKTGSKRNLVKKGS